MHLTSLVCKLSLQRYKGQLSQENKITMINTSSSKVLKTGITQKCRTRSDGRQQSADTDGCYTKLLLAYNAQELDLQAYKENSYHDMDLCHLTELTCNWCGARAVFHEMPQHCCNTGAHCNHKITARFSLEK